jgi:hypothetical protein
MILETLNAQARELEATMAGNRFHLTKLIAALVGLKKTAAPTKSSKSTDKGG